MSPFSAARWRTPVRLAALTAIAASLAGCVSDQGPMASMAYAPADSIAFESVDGPPPQVFDRLVGVLNSESQLRNVTIVSREAPAAYRVRSYLSAQVQRGRTVIAWVWDVYDRNQQRALRLSGEESAGKAGKDAWAAADDMVLRRIAQAGFSGLSQWTGGTGAPQPATQGAEAVVAQSEDAPVHLASGSDAGRLGFSSQ